MPIDQRRRDEIAAAVDAYDSANPLSPLPRNAAPLLPPCSRSRTCASTVWMTSRREGSTERTDCDT